MINLCFAIVTLCVAGGLLWAVHCLNCIKQEATAQTEILTGIATALARDKVVTVKKWNQPS